MQPIGQIVIEFLIENFNNLFVYSYTKGMEDQLDNISKGKKEWHELCRECYDQMENSSVDVKKGNMNDIESANSTHFLINFSSTPLNGRFPII